MNHSNFVAPVVPVSRLNKVYSGSSLYLGLFIPAGGGIWDGNLKKYGLSSTGAVLDINGNPAVDATGTIGATVTSIWSTASDGPEVTRGGAGAVMLNQADRNNFYTYLHHSGGLSMDVNSLSKTNSAITPTTLALTTDTAKNDLIDYLRADGVYAPGGTSAREWVMGDVIHSTPAVLAIGAGKNLIFAGANDGFLHCYVDDDKGNNDVLPNETPVYTDDSVKEAWAFVPPELLASLKNTKSELKSGTAHEYFVDGSPLAYRFGADLYLTFGLRGGGKAYYTLKVGQYAGANPEDEFTDGSYLAPVFKWQIGPTVAGGMEPLGQSWCRPTVMKLKTSSSSTTTAVFLTGGYDPNEDRDRPNGDSPTNAPAPVADDPSDPDDFPINADSMGRSVYAVEASNGSLVGGSSPIFSFSHTGGRTAMTHCIVDQTVFDANNDGYADTAYAADLGGNVFVMTDRDANGSWDFRDLFEPPAGSNSSMPLTSSWRSTASMSSLAAAIATTPAIVIPATVSMASRTAGWRKIRRHCP